MKKNSLVARMILVFALSAGILNAALGDVSPLDRAELGKVQAVLTKLLKGKPTVKNGTKQEVDGGWKINVVADVGSGGAFEFTVMTEKTMTLGYIETQKPWVEKAATTTTTGGSNAGKKS